jgi:23S rRNA pseudouridine2605 synthase
LREGRKRQIREVGKRIGVYVERIQRVRIGTLLLGDLRSGEWRPLSNQEIAALKSSVQAKPAPRPRRSFSKRT